VSFSDLLSFRLATVYHFHVSDAHHKATTLPDHATSQQTANRWLIETFSFSPLCHQFADVVSCWISIVLDKVTTLMLLPLFTA